jgi:hypothetical protein
MQPKYSNKMSVNLPTLSYDSMNEKETTTNGRGVGNVT